MRRHGLRAVLFWLSLLLVITLSASGLAQTGARRRAATQRQPTALFELIERNHNPSIVPILVLQGGRFAAPRPSARTCFTK